MSLHQRHLGIQNALTQGASMKKGCIIRRVRSSATTTSTDDNENDHEDEDDEEEDETDINDSLQRHLGAQNAELSINFHKLPKTLDGGNRALVIGFQSRPILRPQKHYL